MARFTTVNAREMAAKAHAARLQRLASGTPAAATFPQTPQVGPHEAAGAYAVRRLSRVRVQLDLVDKRIEELAKEAAVDGQLLNWLCAAQERLAEQERVLDNRPLPGSRRPSKDDARPRQPGAWLSEPEPMPATQKDGPPDSLPVEPPTPAPTATPTPRSAPSVGPVPIEVALRHRPAPLPTPASPAPTCQKPG
jgi:hypothetical protein